MQLLARWNYSNGFQLVRGVSLACAQGYGFKADHTPVWSYLGCGDSGLTQVSWGNVAASSNNSGFLPLSEATQLEKLLNCEKTYPLVADPNRVSKMKGFYCVTGLRGNFRLVKIFESKKAAKDDTDLYEPIQTGGRNLVVGGNWFVFGLPQDIKAVLNSGLIKRSDSGMGLRDYSTKQDLCMGLSTAAMESHFDNPSGEARHLHDLEWLFKGGTKQVQSAIKGFGPQLKKALLGDDGLLMGQTLASASLVYRPFCLAHKNHGTK